jgi:hypothetical protein
MKKISPSINFTFSEQDELIIESDLFDIANKKSEINKIKYITKKKVKDSSNNLF